MSPYDSEGDTFGLVVFVLAFLLFTTGGMSQAVLASRRRILRGLAVHAGLGAAAVLIVFVPLDYDRQDDIFDWIAAITEWGWPLVAFWALLAALGTGVGLIGRMKDPKPPA